MLVAPPCPNLCDRMDCAHQAPLSIGFSSKNTGLNCRFLLQGIFSTQGWNLGLLHCRRILYLLSPHIRFWSRVCLGGGHGNPLQYSCLENPKDRGASRAVVLGVAKSQEITEMTEANEHSSAQMCIVYTNQNRY